MMRFRLTTLVFFILVCVLQIQCQEISTLFKAKTFGEAYFNPVYQELKQRKENKQFLNEKELKWLEVYQNYIDNYFNLLNKNQQELFHLDRAAFDAEQDSIILAKKQALKQPTTIELVGPENEKNTELLLGHILFSGVSGVVYGVQANYIFNVESETTTIGLIMLLSGGSMLVPIFSPKYDHINSNSLWLRGHGKTMGGLYGYFLAGAILGDDIFENYEDYDYGSSQYRNKKPVALSMSLLGSVSLGHLGFYLGKNKPWTDGRIATYQYYSYALPAFTTLSCLSLTNLDNFQEYAIIATASVPVGYYLAHKLQDKIEYTRGDMTAIINNSVIGGMLAGSVAIYGDFDSREALMWPIGGAVLGSLAGHITYRNFHITRAEGRRLNYAAIGGGLIGLGTALLFEPDSDGTYLLVPTIFGAAGYGLLLSHYYRQPRFSGKNNRLDINFALHPESLLLNKKLPQNLQAPLFSLNIKL